MNLSIILPTKEENENLKSLIPRIVKHLNTIVELIENYEIIVVDEIHGRELDNEGISLPTKALVLTYQILIRANLIQILAKKDSSNLIKGFIISQKGNSVINWKVLRRKNLLLLTYLMPYIIKLVKRSMFNIQLYYKINYDVKIIVFCVKSEFQRTGIGKLLLNNLLATLENNALVILDTKISNFASKSFYTNYGFKEIKITRKHVIYGLRNRI